MKKVETLILEREDLIERYNYVLFEEIEYSHFNISREHLIEKPLIIFIDKAGRTKILKNRFGDQGAVETDRERKMALQEISEKIQNFANSLIL